MFLIFIILSQELITLHFIDNHNIYSFQRIEINYRNVIVGTNPLSALLHFPNFYINYRYGQFQGGSRFSGSSVYRSKVVLAGLKFSNSSNYRNIGVVYGNQYRGLLYEVGYNTDYGR